MKNRKHIICVGDSNTYGTLLLNRKRDCYPSRLQQLLGSQMVVKNEGVHRYAVSRHADDSYLNHPYYKKRYQEKMDVVLIFLGTNDSKEKNQNAFATFYQDYRTLVEGYQNHPDHPKVYVLTPPAMVAKHGKYCYHMQPEIILKIRNWIIQTYPKNCIDIYELTKDHEEYMAIDGIHLNPLGHQMVASMVYHRIKEDLCEEIK